MTAGEVGYVTCPDCGTRTGLERATETGICAGCEREFTGDEPSVVPSALADGHWDDILGDNYEPANDVDFAADEVSEPDRDVEAITEVLVDVETNDRIHATIGAAEARSDATFVVLSHERDVAGFEHRINFLSKPRDDGWTRLYQTGIGPDDLDPWEVVSMPYHVGERTADMRDFAANGWMVDCELTDGGLTPVDQNPERDDVDDRKVETDGGVEISSCEPREAHCQCCGGHAGHGPDPRYCSHCRAAGEHLTTCAMCREEVPKEDVDEFCTDCQQRIDELDQLLEEVTE